MNLEKLPAEAVRLVEAATGWLELGNWREANEELEEIEASWRAHPVVLAVRSRVYAAAGKYDEAVMIAEAGFKFLPPEARADALYDLAVWGPGWSRSLPGRGAKGECVPGRVAARG